MQLFNCIFVDVHLMCIDRVKALTTAKKQKKDPVESSSTHMQLHFHCEQVQSRTAYTRVLPCRQQRTCMLQAQGSLA